MCNSDPAHSITKSLRLSQRWNKSETEREKWTGVGRERGTEAERGREGGRERGTEVEREWEESLRGEGFSQR